MKFSIVIPFFQGTQTEEELTECLDSIDYPCEVLVYHDGPLHRKTKHSLKPTDRHFNDYGHSLRSLGIAEATGEYIIHCNADNVFYPGALKKLSEATKTNQDIYICNLVMKYCIMRDIPGPVKIWRTGDPEDKALLTGDPPVFMNIDAMQLVMKTKLWKKYDWYDKSQNSDGPMYERFCKEHKPTFTNICLGEHR